MLFMVIEHFKNRDAKAVYRRAKEHGRMLPEGSKYEETMQALLKELNGG